MVKKFVSDRLLIVLITAYIMIHPGTILKFIDDSIGYGVFATEFIHEGTITYVKDSLEISITPEEYQSHSEELKQIIEKYSYIDEYNNRIISWDHAKYVNHCCNCNTMSTGYGFEIAIRSILPGEQITDEYGIFNLEYEMPIHCGHSACRKILHPNDFDSFYHLWDTQVKKSLEKFFEVDQPLINFVEQTTRNELNSFFVNHKNYKSVYSLKVKKDLPV